MWGISDKVARIPSGMLGWAVAATLLGVLLGNYLVDKKETYNPLFCSLYYSSSTHKSERWADLPYSSCVEDRRTGVIDSVDAAASGRKGDRLPYHRE